MTSQAAEGTISGSEKRIRFEVEGHVAVLTLNRPEKKNAVDGEMARDIEATLDVIEDADDIWVGILAAEGDVYCAGADLAVIAEGRSSELLTDRGGWAGFVARDRQKPFIAAVEGKALAGGFELALACDLVVASSAATFGLPEVSRGLIPAAGGMFRLPQVIPQKLAIEMLMVGSAISAERAKDLGVVNQVVEPGCAVPRARALAEAICTNSPLSVRAARRVALASSRSADRAGWEATWAAVAELENTEDFQEGPRAFLERRQPVWKAR